MSQAEYDEQVRIDRLMEDAFRIEAAVEQALCAIKVVHGPVDDMPHWPEAWESDKPFANVSMEGDEGDASVGIQDWSGLCLSTDQSGTVLGDILAARASPYTAVTQELPQTGFGEDDPHGLGPRVSEWVLVKTAHGQQYVAQLVDWADPDEAPKPHWIMAGRDGYRVDDVTAWMPLP